MRSRAPMPNDSVPRIRPKHLPATADTPFAPLATSCWTVPSYPNHESTRASSTSMSKRPITAYSPPIKGPCDSWTSSRNLVRARAPRLSLLSHTPPPNQTDYPLTYTPRPMRTTFFCPHTANRPYLLPCGPSAHLLIIPYFMSCSPYTGGLPTILLSRRAS